MRSELPNSIKNRLQDLGINKGDSIIVHSALGALGKIPEKAQLITEILKGIIAYEGTLLMPALSYETVTKENPVFNQKNTPSCVGWLTEYFRNLPGVKRSIHPTHSVCAIGRKSNYFIDNHALDNTPCGSNSPFRKLRETGGKILFLGCSLKSNTSMHGVEELTVPKYLYGEEIEYTMETEKDGVYKKKYIPHNFKGFQQRYDRVTDILSNDDYAFRKILGADTYLINSIPLWEKAHKKLSENPLYFVDEIPD